MSRPDRAPLLADMRRALLSEFGALAIYGRLARSRRDRELSELLDRFRVEEREQIDRLRGLMTSLGGDPPARSLRRRFVPWLLHLASGCGARRLALRSCLDAEETVSGWYAQYATHLAETGEADGARTCEVLAVTKRRHALALRAWVER